MDDLAENNPRRSTSNPMLLSPKVDQVDDDSESNRADSRRLDAQSNASGAVSIGGGSKASVNRAYVPPAKPEPKATIQEGKKAFKGSKFVGMSKNTSMPAHMNKNTSIPSAMDKNMSMPANRLNLDAARGVNDYGSNRGSNRNSVSPRGGASPRVGSARFSDRGGPGSARRERRPIVAAGLDVLGTSGKDKSGTNLAPPIFDDNVE